MDRFFVFAFVLLTGVTGFAGSSDDLFDALKMQERHQFRVAEIARTLGLGTEAELKAKLGDSAVEILGIEPFKKAFHAYVERKLSPVDVKKTIEFYRSPSGKKFFEFWARMPELTQPYYEEREARARAKLNAAK